MAHRLPLESLFRCRVRWEDAAWRRLGAALSSEQRARAVLAKAERDALDAAHRLRSILAERTTGEVLHRHVGVDAARRRQRAQRAAALAAASLRVVEARQAYLARRRERQVVEAIRQCALAQWRAAELRALQASTDEIATARWVALRRSARG